MRYTENTMIRCVTGTILEHTEGSVVIEVGGLGYLVNVTNDWQPSGNDKVRLWTYLAVRENSLDLYGFNSRSHCNLFEQLLTVPKVGPKSALQILNKASPELLVQTIKGQDPSGLAKRSGIGQKTAEKLVQTLQDNSLFDTLLSTDITNQDDDEATATLIALGYPERIAYDTVRTVLQEQKADVDTQTIVRAALQKLSTH